ncbi:MAG: 5,10-methylenetetrahydrofolate reductase [Desulfobacteraceae bacterium]|nr:methylenetetrahydrofolate reductase [Desulfobacteraceae bacterium]MBC2755273.1 5,10-methylenetetrahydrofolate reductase [Desulfobacteraceae bacterium]
MDLKRKLETKDFAILAEIEPPKGSDIAAMVNNAAKVKEEVTAFVIPEMSNAVMRMSALGAAMVLEAKRMETVMQVCCRDRNRIALQADLLAASACGINNVMAVTGEDPSFGDHHQAAAVYDIDIDELLKTIQGLEKGKDMAGIELSGSPDFTVGSMVNSGLEGTDLDREIDAMKRKIDAGVRFFITPPLFDVSAIEPFMNKINTSGIHIIPTVVLLKSLGMARYMARNMKHVYIPDELVKRIQKAPDKVRECIRIAKESVSAVKKNGFSGAMISTIGWEDRLYDIIHGI